jgi:anti-sigma B factor antagonist
MLQIDVEPAGAEYRTTVVRCAGEIDVATCASLIDTFDNLVPDAETTVRVDLCEVTFIDSTGIGCLLHAALQARAAGTPFEIVPGETTTRFISSSGLGNQLPLVPA